MLNLRPRAALTAGHRFADGLLATAALALLAAAALVAFAGGEQPATAAKTARTIDLVVESDRDPDARHELAPAGDSPGDEVISSDAIYASDDRTRRGRALFVTTFHEQTGALVTGALRMREGTITLAGARINGAGSLAVTGGTGAYAGASGTYRTGAIVRVLGEDGPVRQRVRIVLTPR